MDKMTNENPNKVGYKNPPKQTQFKKGESGNPKGRPKSIPNQSITEDDLLQIILKDASENISITTGGNKKDVPSIEAVLKAMKVKAISGKIGAAKEYLRLVQTAQTRQQQNYEIKMQAIMNIAHDIDTLDNDTFYKKHIMIKDDARSLIDVLIKNANNST